MAKEFDLGFPRVKSMERLWEEIRSNLKLWGFKAEEAKGGCIITRFRDGKTVEMMWMELYELGIDEEAFKRAFEHLSNPDNWDCCCG